MYCEECESKMRWRCTNKITHISKYKCPNCGHIQTEKAEIIQPVEETKKDPKYYYETTKGTFIIRKTIDKEKVSFGTYGNEDTVKKVVSELVKCDWKLDNIPSIRSKLNINKVNRSWVCV